MATQKMSVEQLHEYVRAQERDNMKSQYQAQYSQGKPQERKFRPSTAVKADVQNSAAASRFRDMHRAANDRDSQAQAYKAMGQSAQRLHPRSRQYDEVRSHENDARSNRSMRSQFDLHHAQQELGVCPKHGPMKGTLHPTGKSNALLSPAPSQRRGADRNENVRNMHTQKFLQTDLKSYLERDEHVTCISCQHCVRIKDKVLQYKYNRQMRSNYGANYANTKGHEKQKIWNLDQEKRLLKVPYKPPATYVTTNSAALINSKGTGMIGAMTADGKGYVRSGAPKGETEDDVPKAFVNSSSYQLTYPVYGKLPEANKRPHKAFAAGYGKVDGVSAYKSNFCGAPDDRYRETAKLEKQRVNAYQKQQVRGTLKPSVPLPFEGESTNQKEYVKRKNDAVEKVLPFSMLVVPHGMSMHTKSEARSKFNAKPIRKLH